MNPACPLPSVTARRSCLAALLLLPMALPLSHAAMDTTTARKLVAGHYQSVLGVRAVLKVQPFVNGNPMPGDRELEINTTGTAVDSTGTVIVCSLQLNPVGALIKKPVRVENQGQSMEVEIKSRLENLRYILPDQSESPARILLEDDDLALVVLAPELKPDAKAPKLEPVRLEDDATPGVFTQYVVVDRGNLSFRDAPMVGGGMVGAILTKPRPFYAQDLARHTVFLGSPFYDLGGRLLGIGSLSLRPPADFNRPQLDSWPVPVIVPASEVRDLVRRALKSGDTAKAPSPPPASTDELESLPVERATNVLRNCGEAVVVVEGTIKYNCGRCAEEHSDEINAIGTVLDGAGLAVIPSGGRAGGSKYSEQNVHYVLADRSEVPARIILEDEDLELSVLAPATQPDRADAFKALPLTPGANPDLLDHVLILSRLGKDHRYLSAVSISRIMARVTKPRPFYLADINIAGPWDQGQPVFLPDGRLVGVVSTEPEADDPEDAPSLPGLDGGMLQRGGSRVVPVSALVDLLQQARQAQAKIPSPSAAVQGATITR